MNDGVPDWLKNDLAEIKTYMRNLPDALDEKFLRRGEFREFRLGLDERLKELVNSIVDVGASTARAHKEIDGIKVAMVTKKTIYSVAGLCVALLGAVGGILAAVLGSHR